MGGGLSPPVALLIQWATDRVRYPYGERHSLFIVVLMATLLAMTLVVVAPILLVYDACHAFGYFLYGLDRHAWEVTVSQAVDVRIITWTIALTYMLITALVKISILIFYRRLSKGTFTTSWMWTVRIFILFVASLAVSFTILLCVGCRPLDAFWHKMDFIWALQNNYTCIDEAANFITYAVINVITDAAVCILPLLVVSRLQMPRKQKWAVGALFGIGFFLCVCGVMRLVWMYITYYKTYDTTWTATYIWSWTLVETHFSIICASAPALNIFFRRILQPTHASDSDASHQRKALDNFGSCSNRSGRAGPSHGNGDVESGIYMADMLAYKAAKAEAERDDPVFSMRESEAKRESMAICREVDEAASDGDEQGIEEQSRKSSRGSRGSTESILETHVAIGFHE
ncbi:uncharacterized protein BKCO1_25000126 [Diplodia corticola]|uniref:Integral membrane protein n=1 Tax=Diplodia corticola TaxID=236234 RepID=A0A1J9S265_9PEZI|nr:uncharacterized protein BKCO1_25000126 [Diplodia corticola]OJD34100.1 integral membrane protein [Diplodia corticola]